MTNPVRILVVGLGNMGRSHALAYHRLDGFEIVGLTSRTIRSTAHRLPPSCVAIRCLRTTTRRCGRPGPTRSRSTPTPTAMPPTPSGPWTPAATCSWRSRSRPASPTPRRSSPRPRRPAQARARLHPARASGLGEADRDRPRPRQAAGDADESEPAVERPGLGLAQRPDGEHDADRRLRRALCRRDVPAHRATPGAGAWHRRQAGGRDQGAELRPSARRLRGRLGRLVRGGLGADDVARSPIS